MTLGDVADAVGGTLDRGQRDAAVGGFSIDTRTLRPGDLFFAIRGDRFDGHRFAGAAAQAGAVGLVASDVAGLPSSIGVIAVADTVAALQRLAAQVRRESGTSVVAVTGSAGKSTTKEIVAEFLATRYRVFRNAGNLNNHIGLPLSLLELRRKPEIAVVELGMNHAGEISTLVKIASPDVRVWTNVGAAHLEFFGTLDAIADAKAEILEGAGPHDLLVANADDERVMRRARRFAGRVRTFGIDRAADVRASDIRDHGIDGTSAQVHTPRGNTELQTPLPGRANLANALAATCVALHFDVPLSDIVSRAATLEPVEHRGRVIRTPAGVTILDDSYNSNPEALSKALWTIKEESRYRRRIAVIGEMLELGAASGELHEAAGRAAALAGVATLVAVGGDAARRLADGAVQAGMSASDVHCVEDSAKAADIVAATVQPGDLVLVKGSRGIRTDLVVERLKAEHV